jgi:hypothetical protein
VAGWGSPACRTSTRGPARQASIPHQVAARSSGMAPISAASPPGGAETHHMRASWRRSSGCRHGTPGTAQRHAQVRDMIVWHPGTACGRQPCYEGSPRAFDLVGCDFCELVLNLRDAKSGEFFDQLRNYRIFKKGITS